MATCNMLPCCVFQLLNALCQLNQSMGNKTVKDKKEIALAILAIFQFQILFPSLNILAHLLSILLILLFLVLHSMVFFSHLNQSMGRRSTFTGMQRPPTPSSLTLYLPFPVSCLIIITSCIIIIIIIISSSNGIIIKTLFTFHFLTLGCLETE